MSAAEKVVVGAVSLVITLLAIALGFKMVNRTEEMSDIVVEEQDRTLQKEREYNVIKYDGYDINGSIAVNYVKTLVSEQEIEVVIVKGANTVTVTETGQFAGLRRIDSEYYLNPLKEYTCEVVRDVNEEISSVILTEIP